MKAAKLVSVTLFIAITFTVQAQKWSVRASLGATHNWCYAASESWRAWGPYPQVDIKTNYPGQNIFTNKRTENQTISGVSLGISGIRQCTPRKAVQLGYSYMSFILSPGVSIQLPDNRVQYDYHPRHITVHSIKANYLYTFLKSSHENPSSLSLTTGLLVSLPLGGTKVDTTLRTTQFREDFHTYQITGASRPGYPVPYFNFGIDGGIRLSSRYKLGLEFTGYIGPETLYRQGMYGRTGNAEFSYSLQINRYFYTGTIYLQYKL